jgi:hypothetical protein
VFVDIRAQELHVLDRLCGHKHVGAVIVSPPPFNVPLDLGRFCCSSSIASLE